MSESVPPPLDLTLALVGKRRIEPRHLDVMKADLAFAFDVIAEALDDRAAGDGARLTLITGLADGADQIAGTVFLSAPSTAVSRVLGAILPCPGEEFAHNSPVEDLEAFERAAETCAFITVLRGRLRPPPPDGLNTDAARQDRRARGDAFAAQADALLQEAGILIAIDDPEQEGEMGGTRHSLNRALARGMPVILLHLGRPGISLPSLGSPVERDETLQGEAARRAVAALVDSAARFRDATGG